MKAQTWNLDFSCGRSAAVRFARLLAGFLFLVLLAFQAGHAEDAGNPTQISNQVLSDPLIVQKGETFLSFRKRMIERLEQQTRDSFWDLPVEQQRLVLGKIIELYWGQIELERELTKHVEAPISLDKPYPFESVHPTIENFLYEVQGMSEEEAIRVSREILELFLQGLEEGKRAESSMSPAVFSRKLDKNLVFYKNQNGKAELNVKGGKKFIKVVHTFYRSENDEVSEVIGENRVRKIETALSFDCSEKIDPRWRHNHQYIASQHLDGKKYAGRDIAIVYFQNGNSRGFSEVDRVEYYPKHSLFSVARWIDFNLATPFLGLKPKQPSGRSPYDQAKDRVQELIETKGRSVCIGIAFGVIQGLTVPICDVVHNSLEQMQFTVAGPYRWELALYTVAFSGFMGFFQDFLRKVTNRGKSDAIRNLKRIILTGLPYNVPVYLATYSAEVLDPTTLSGIFLWSNMIAMMYVGNFSKVWLDKVVEVDTRARDNVHLVKKAIPFWILKRMPEDFVKQVSGFKGDVDLIEIVKRLNTRAELNAVIVNVSRVLRKFDGQSENAELKKKLEETLAAARHRHTELLDQVPNIEIEKKANLQSRVNSLKTSTLRLLDATGLRISFTGYTPHPALAHIDIVSGIPIGKLALISSYFYFAHRAVRHAEAKNSDLAVEIREKYHRQLRFIGTWMVPVIPVYKVVSGLQQIERMALSSDKRVATTKAFQKSVENGVHQAAVRFTRSMISLQSRYERSGQSRGSRLVNGCIDRMKQFGLHAVRSTL